MTSFMISVVPPKMDLRRLSRQSHDRAESIHSLLRARSSDQMLCTAAAWASPWLPPRYEQNIWNAA
jgi:hypothetical protein